MSLSWPLQAGDLVWKTKDDAIEASLRSSYEGLAASETRKVVVDLALEGGLGSSLALTLSDGAVRGWGWGWGWGCW
jgi:hypothetical protein